MTSQVFKDPNILNLLEWPIIEKQIQSYAHFNTTANDYIFVFKKPKTIKYIFSQINILTKYLHEDIYQDALNSLRYFNNDGRISNYISRLGKSAFLSLEELNEVALLIEFYLSHFSFIENINLISESKDQFHNTKRTYLKSFLKEFRSFVDKSGDIDYFKHPLLRELYSEQNSIEQDIRKTLNAIGTDSNYSNVLQFSGFDIINDRYVIPIKSDHYQSHLGQIISRSETGHTLFVEPSKIRNLNFKRLEIVLKLQKEIENLTIRFSKSLTDSMDHLTNLRSIVFSFDELNTRTTYGYSKNFIEPKLSFEPSIFLKDFYHPLIEDPIKNSITLGHDHQGLIISGPNTGGKTAALKSLTLIQLFTRFGLFVPASEASVHLYEEIFYFGNDGQNLPEGLSSFAAEVKNYSELFENLGKTNLIVIDEIFNTTSSEEASALAISLFEQLGKISSSHLLVSTHHQMLKTFIHGDDKFLSAHVGFDSDTSKPTYKLFYGSPGGSQALRIFSLLTSKNDINKAIYDNALKVLDKKMVSYESLLEKISHKENELSNLILENKTLNQQLKNQKSSMEGVYKLKLDEKIAKVDKDISKILDRAEHFFLNSKKGKFDSKRSFEKELNEVKSLYKTISNETKPEVNRESKYSTLKKPLEVKVGEKYFSIFLEQTVLVKSINHKKKEATVSKGLMSIKCPLSTLRVASGKVKQEVHISVAKSNAAKIEHDCRGMRLSEFQSLVEFAVSDLLGGAIPFVTFIHGHGNGTLKKWIRDYIKNNPDITEETNETGNDGETKIILT